MDKLKIELSNPNFDPRNNWQWDNDDSLEQLIMSLNDMKMSLETDLAQAIQGYTFGRQRTLTIIKDVLPDLDLQIKVEESEHNLEGLLEVVEVKKKVDVCLNKLNSIMQT